MYTDTEILLRRKMRHIKIFIYGIGVAVSFDAAFSVIGGCDMETRVAVVGIIVEDVNSAESLNEILHAYGQYIVGRMGIPYRERGINVISLVVDAPQTEISAMTGKIGRLDGISVKAAYSSI